MPNSKQYIPYKFRTSSAKGGKLRLVLMTRVHGSLWIVIPNNKESSSSSLFARASDSFYALVIALLIIISLFASPTIVIDERGRSAFVGRSTGPKRRQSLNCSPTTQLIRARKMREQRERQREKKIVVARKRRNLIENRLAPDPPRVQFNSPMDVGEVKSGAGSSRKVPTKVNAGEKNSEEYEGSTTISALKENEAPIASDLIEIQRGRPEVGQDLSISAKGGEKIASADVWVGATKDEQNVPQDVHSTCTKLNDQFIAPENNIIVHNFRCKVCDYDEERQVFYKQNIEVNGKLYESGQFTLHMIGNKECVNPHLKWNINIKAAVINAGLASRDGDIYMIGRNWATDDRLGEKRILVLRFRRKNEGNGGWRAATFEAAFRQLQAQLGLAPTVENECEVVEELTQASQHMGGLLPDYDGDQLICERG